MPRLFPVAGIYQIVHVPTGRLYVGSSANVSKRTNEHRRLLESQDHYNRKLQNAWNKYGGEEFAFAIVECVPDLAMLINREQHYIDTLKPAFNLSPTAGSCRGIKHRPLSIDEKHAISVRQTGKKYRPMSAHGRTNIALALRGTKRGPCSKERKRNISEALKRRAQTPAFHKWREETEAARLTAIRSPEVRAKIAATVKAKVSPEHLAMMRQRAAAVAGPHSAETRAKISEALRGKKKRPEVVEAMRERLTGRSLTEEHKRAIAEGVRRARAASSQQGL